MEENHIIDNRSIHNEEDNISEKNSRSEPIFATPKFGTEFPVIPKNVDHEVIK